ncbi:MAG: PhzF family phenazine biosynthesis isomerase [Candidatus Obscuribacterales bacterium]|nr:PhzF family phenazine biosynthesis isomerase [Steroidobacteraceae bacterium]
MTVQVLHFDAFTSEPGKGNPAGIVLSADTLDDTTMQALAKATGFNDTAFVMRSKIADFRLRYFSPRKEVDLCGHATIAGSIALYARGALAGRPLPCDFSIETEVGVLPIRVDSNPAAEQQQMVFMTQVPAQFKEFSGDRTRLAQALNLSTADFHPQLPLIFGSTGRWTLIVPVRGLDAMRRMHPQVAMFAEVLADLPAASIHPFCLEAIEADVDMHARHFSAPGSGTLEDPVTGTASGVLGAYYREFIDKNGEDSQPLIVEQGYEMGRAGRVLVWVTKSTAGYNPRIAGTACFVEERSYPNVLREFNSTRCERGPG